MSFAIASIVWPRDARAAIDLYLRFQAESIEQLDPRLAVALVEPLEIVRRYLGGVISENERVAASEQWWQYIEGRGKLREFGEKDVLIARLAISLLGVKESDVPELGEQLSWFVELLQFLGYDVSPVLKRAQQYFVRD